MQILLTGSIAIDRIMSFPGKFSDVIRSEKLSSLSLSVLVDKLVITRGGVAANIAYTLALLGEKPILFGSVGDDARKYMTDLAKMGISTAHLYYSPLSTASFSVINDVSNCQIGGFYPGAMSDSETLSLQKFKDEDVLVVISPHDPAQMARQVAECARFKKRLFYDVGQQVSNIDGKDIAAGISAAELLIVNEYEMNLIVQKTGWMQAEIEKKVTVCVVTYGKHGCQITQHGQKLSAVKAIPNTKVVDPTGAGDAFRAGFLYGYINNFPLTECAELGSTAAVYAISYHGTQSHTFTKAEFFDQYHSHYHHKRSSHVSKS